MGGPPLNYGLDLLKPRGPDNHEAHALLSLVAYEEVLVNSVWYQPGRV